MALSSIWLTKSCKSRDDPWPLKKKSTLTCNHQVFSPSLSYIFSEYNKFFPSPPCISLEETTIIFQSSCFTRDCFSIAPKQLSSVKPLTGFLSPFRYNCKVLSGILTSCYSTPLYCPHMLTNFIPEPSAPAIYKNFFQVCFSICHTLFSVQAFAQAALEVTVSAPSLNHLCCLGDS